jgi:hypothetical protein
MVGYPAEVQKRLRERCEEDRRQARFLIVLGTPFALGSVIGLSFPLSFLLWWMGVPYLLAAFLSFFLVGGGLALDTWRHPSVHRRAATYYLGGTIDTSTDPDALKLVAADGVFAGMPLMASVSDPGDLAEHGPVLLRGCTHILFGGSRNIRTGIELLRATEARGDTKVESAAVRFLAWLKDEEPVTEEEVADQMKKDPSLRQGFTLAHELGLLRRRKEGPQRLLEMKEPSMREDAG